MTAIDLLAPTPVGDVQVPALFLQLKALRDAVAAGRCRIGVDNEEQLPCLLGLIMEMMPHCRVRDQLIEAVAERLPGAGMARPQMRMMRYCRSSVASRRAIVRAIEGAMIALDAPLRSYGFRLMWRKLISRNVQEQ